MSHSLEFVVYGIGLFILGTIFGSFGGVLIERLAESCNRKTIRSILTGGSICPACTDHRELSRYELIPIVSRIRQGGRCMRCSSSIPQWYLRLEIASGLIFVMTYLRGVHFGLPLTEIVRRLIINRLLLLILTYDLQTQYLHMPIRYLLAVVVIGFLSTHIHIIHDPQTIAYSLIIWGGMMGLIRRGASIYARSRYGQPEGIGSGDVIIIATVSPLLPFIIQRLQFIVHSSQIFTITQLFFYLLIIAGIVSLLIAALTHKNKAGQTLAFLPGLIIAWRILTRIAPLIMG